MEIAPLTKDTYRSWDEFCLESDDAWFWHTSKWMEYVLNFWPDSTSDSKSFFVIKNGRVAAICPFILEENNGVKEFSYLHSFGFLPAFANYLTRKEKEQVMKFSFEHIDVLAKENGVKRTSMRCAVLNRSFIETLEQTYNHTMRFGYLDTSLNTQVIDLRRPLGELRLEVRHGHDADIDKASKVLRAEIFDSSNITKEVFDGYLSLHHKDKGRLKRKEVTFDMMYDWIKEDNAFLIGAKRGDAFIGFSYFFCFKNNVYYGSACNDPEAPNLPVAHFIQWSAIQWMHEKKFKFYETGWQYYENTLSDFPTKKEADISRFKRGFGGRTVSLFRGEKYYDKDYFLNEQQLRIKKYAELTFQTLS